MCGLGKTHCMHVCLHVLPLDGAYLVCAAVGDEFVEAHDVPVENSHAVESFGHHLGCIGTWRKEQELQQNGQEQEQG